MKKYIISLMCVLFISGLLFGQIETVEPEDIVLKGTLVNARIVHLDFKNNSRADVWWELKIDNQSNGDIVVKLVKASDQNQHFEIGEKYIVFKWRAVIRAMKVK
ncbi:MAG: hypothetical protein MUP98_01610 [Candidatus Aminicenantes bacterium]|nr:hypothetical protein [Candidatus Aminicenantes bacterium]